MKAKVLKQFRDKETGKVRKVGEIFTCNKSRFAEILKNGEAQRAGVLIEEYKAEESAK